MPRITQQMMIMIFFCTREAGKKGLSVGVAGAGRETGPLGRALRGLGCWRGGWRGGCRMGREGDGLKLVWGGCYNEALKAWETWVRLCSAQRWDRGRVGRDL